MDLQRRQIALVTGASAGIGVGIARVLAAEGAQLAISARRADNLRTLAKEITGAGGKPPLVVPADLTDDNGPAALAETVLADLGRVDILVNNAGLSRTLPENAPEAAWDEAMMLKFTMGRRLTYRLAGMRARGWGRIIHVTGVLEPFTNAGLAGCAATMPGPRACRAMS